METENGTTNNESVASGQETQTQEGTGGGSSTENTHQAGTSTLESLRESIHQKAAAGGAGDKGASGGVAGATADGANPEPYTPNFKFKVKDKELEFDDFIKPLVKTKDLETKLRDIYEKAHGLDEVKSSRESFKQQAEEYKTKFSTMEQSLQTLGTYVKKGDFRTFFQALNIPKEQIINYAIQELKYQELPPEQRAAIDMQREQEQALMQATYQNQTLQQQMANLARQQAEFEVSQALAAPEVSSVAQAFDARVGTPGAFRAEVVRRGQYYETVHKISPPASQLVQEILNFVGVPAQTQQGSQAPSQEMPGPAISNQQKPVISSFSGGGAKSPTRKVPTSVDDLRKLRQNL